MRVLPVLLSFPVYAMIYFLSVLLVLQLTLILWKVWRNNAVFKIVLDIESAKEEEYILKKELETTQEELNQVKECLEELNEKITKKINEMRLKDCLIKRINN